MRRFKKAAAVLLSLLLMLSLSACGGSSNLPGLPTRPDPTGATRPDTTRPDTTETRPQKTELSRYAGTYTLFALTQDGYIVASDSSDSELVLNEDGTGELTIDGTSGSITAWTVENRRDLTITTDGHDISGLFSKGIITLDFGSGTEWYLAREDADISVIETVDPAAMLTAQLAGEYRAVEVATGAAVKSETQLNVLEIIGSQAPRLTLKEDGSGTFFHDGRSDSITWDAEGIHVGSGLLKYTYDETSGKLIVEDISDGYTFIRSEDYIPVLRWSEASDLTEQAYPGKIVTLGGSIATIHLPDSFVPGSVNASDTDAGVIAYYIDDVNDMKIAVWDYANDTYPSTEDFYEYLTGEPDVAKLTWMEINGVLFTFYELPDTDVVAIDTVLSDGSLFEVVLYPIDSADKMLEYLFLLSSVTIK